MTIRAQLVRSRSLVPEPDRPPNDFSFLPRLSALGRSFSGINPKIHCPYRLQLFFPVRPFSGQRTARSPTTGRATGERSESEHLRREPQPDRRRRRCSVRSTYPWPSPISKSGPMRNTSPYGEIISCRDPGSYPFCGTYTIAQLKVTFILEGKALAAAAARWRNLQTERSPVTEKIWGHSPTQP